MNAVDLPKERRGGIFREDFGYQCPNCSQASSVRVWRFAGKAEECSAWDCPHCQARLRFVEQLKWRRFLATAACLLAAVNLGPKLSGIDHWLLIFLAVFAFFGCDTLARYKVAVAPGPKTWE